MSIAVMPGLSHRLKKFSSFSNHVSCSSRTYVVIELRPGGTAKVTQLLKEIRRGLLCMSMFRSESGHTFSVQKVAEKRNRCTEIRQPQFGIITSIRTSAASKRTFAV